MIEELMNNAVVVAAILAPIITGIVEVIKIATEVNKRYLPLISLFIGVVAVLSIGYVTNQDLVQYALAGIISGLGSAGLYDQKKIVE